MTSLEDDDLRQRVHGLLEVVAPPVAPVDAIIRRGRGIRMRRAGVAVGGLGLAAIIAALVLTPPAAPRPPAPPAPLPATETAGPGGVFARGVADGHAWRLAVQNIADPGYRCVPAVTVNGTDADPVVPSTGHYADVTLGRPRPASVSRSSSCPPTSGTSSSTARKASRRPRRPSAGCATASSASPSG